jgi:lipopolysaccharide/colanic/teichoic acid biosynthesis glycosyltransferase
VTGKRLFDLALAVLMSVPALPLILIAVVLVKLSSRGPAIYTQVRVGLNGENFVIYKIRTMRNDCEKLTGPRWADRGRDPRVTLIGNILRKTHIDELPQLINVFRGEMMLVGPRPERPEFVTQLEQVIPGYRERLRVCPGVTGLAQVLLPPDVDVHSVRSKLMYDLFYLNRESFWLDLKIIFCTAFKVVGVPRNISRKLLGVPDESKIEMIYESIISNVPVISEEAIELKRPEVEMQPAF